MGPKTFLLQIVGLTVRYGVDSEEDKTDNMNQIFLFDWNCITIKLL